jgi:hypothetical protein
LRSRTEAAQNEVQRLSSVGDVVKKMVVTDQEGKQLVQETEKFRNDSKVSAESLGQILKDAQAEQVALREVLAHLRNRYDIATTFETRLSTSSLRLDVRKLAGLSTTERERRRDPKRSNPIKDACVDSVLEEYPTE